MEPIIPLLYMKAIMVIFVMIAIGGMSWVADQLTHHVHTFTPRRDPWIPTEITDGQLINAGKIRENDGLFQLVMEIIIVIGLLTY